jgi:hypothetical protein
MKPTSQGKHQKLIRMLQAFVAGERSAALGCRPKWISSFFPSGLARLMRAKPEGKKEVGWVDPLPRAAASAALP